MRKILFPIFVAAVLALASVSCGKRQQARSSEHIFEHFVQLDDYREGTGIGLSLARTLARRLGGDVVLDTSYSFGARFVFSLPL